MTSARPVIGPEVRDSVGSTDRKGPVQHVIETLATAMGNAIGFAAETGILFVIFAALWAAFGAGLIWSQGSVDAAWNSIRALPLVIQGIVWILFLPVMAGMWIWETTWPLLMRLLLIVSLAGWNLLVFLPRVLTTARP